MLKFGIYFKIDLNYHRLRNKFVKGPGIIIIIKD